MKPPLFVVTACTAALLAGCGAASPVGVEPSVPPPASPTVVISTPTGPVPPPSPRPFLIGRLNPAVTESTVKTTVCKTGWTKSIRPSVTFTNAVKRQQLPPGASPAAYEEDHLMPLELGGAPRDPRNLWPVKWARARLDDAWETRLHKELCAGEVTLMQAQIQISTIKRRP